MAGHEQVFEGFFVAVAPVAQLRATGGWWQKQGQLRVCRFTEIVGVRFVVECCIPDALNKYFLMDGYLLRHPFCMAKIWNHPIETTNVINVVCFVPLLCPEGREQRHLCISTGLSLLAHRPYGTREDPVFQLHERLCCFDDTMRFRRVCNKVFIIICARVKSRDIAAIGIEFCEFYCVKR